MKRGDVQGFTLIEVMIIVGIIGLVSLIAIPNMIGWRGERQLDGAARNFMADMQLAKLKAIREAEDVCVNINVAGDSYQMIVDSNNDCTFDPGETQFRNVSMPAGIIISGTTFGSANTKFNSRGMPDKAGRATFRNTAGTISQVFMNRVGRLRIQ
jgi:type IV fimbrial biogenesis protein FimT